MSKTRKEKLVEELRQIIEEAENQLINTPEEKNTVFEEVNQKLDHAEAMLVEFTSSKLVIMDKEYNLRDWMTLSDYCKKYNIKPSRLSNWIDRGIVPEGSMIIIPELNGLKLIKNQPFMARPYEVRNAAR